MCELRTLYKFIHSTIYPESPRYSHYIAFNREVEGGLRKYNSRSTRTASTSIRESVCIGSDVRTTYNLDDTSGGGRYNQTRMRWAHKVGDKLLPDGFTLNNSSLRWSSQLRKVLRTAENREVLQSEGGERVGYARSHPVLIWKCSKSRVHLL